MSRKSYFFLLAVVTIIGIQAFREPAASGQQAGPLSTVPGDVNCDDSVDITDPIYLLRFLFIENAPAPCGIAQGTDSGLPIGTILPFSGDSAQFNSSEWEICDGRTVVDPDPQLRDGDPQQAGIQTPNLQGTFLRGTDEEHSVGTKGGTDIIPEETLTSRWAKYNEGTWTGFDSTGEDAHIIGWGDGHGNQGSNNYSLARSTRTPIDYFTEPTSHDHGGDNRPRFTSVQYLIKVR